MITKDKKCSQCHNSMKPYFGGLAFKCKCGNTFLAGKGYARLQPGEEIYIQEATIQGKPVFYPAIKKFAEPVKPEPEELILFVKPEEMKANGRYLRNANEILYGGIYYVDFDNDYSGREIKKTRPCIVFSHVQQTEYISVVTIVPITSREHEEDKSHVTITSTGIVATALVEQITTVDTKRIGDYMGMATVDEMKKIKWAIRQYLGIAESSTKSTQDDLANLEAENYALRSQLQELTDEVTRLRKARIRWEEEKWVLTHGQP